ncbi:choline dehydrogenase [Undibacter mobilis]|uniref:Choline dehydrogenase n=1 Tax=Undibacter mobilis TaxID=2292256 RepID=A0A371B420_9BRAD|nr:choline dehydrogenase [Undibacter mobilis]RDV02252.1 choline dehydrogenase [Undibacter mobilis]
MATETYDSIIIGGGSAGCVVANRLSARSGRRVLLLEAGRQEQSPLIRMPAGFASVSSNSRFLWGYSTEPEPYLDNRRIACERGRLLGGCSSINAMAFVRGHPADFDGWATVAGAQWSYANCLPHFKSLERFSEPKGPRGNNGPLSVIAPEYSCALNELFVQACVSAGFPQVKDINATKPDGVGPMDQTIDHGERASAATAFLAPLRRHPNLEVRTAALVTRIVLSRGRAIGVEISTARGTSTIYANEIVLSAGTINSPQLLMLSGIGPSDHLRETGVEPVHDLPGVGQNLQDHVDVSLMKECVAPISASPLLAPHRKLLLGLRWLLSSGGPGATNHFEVAAYVRTSPELQRPDIQYCFIPMLTSTDGSRMGKGHGYQIAVMLLQPKSRGTVMLRDRNPLSPPLIRFNYLKEPDDIHSLRQGLVTLRRILDEAPMAAVSGEELSPGPSNVTDSDLDRFIRATAKSTHHPCGTCRMGNDDSSVVDGWGRVHGIEGLRVVDASIMPVITAGNINAPTMMIAEKIANHMLSGATARPRAQRAFGRTE